MRAKVLLDLVAKKLFLTKGMGVHEDKLTSFEYALRNAGIAGTNLVLISSIFPPGAKLISRTAGLKLIKPGQILFTIYSKNQTNEPRRHITASVGIAQPKDNCSRYGYLSEYDSFGQSQKEAGDYAEDIAAQMLASSLGIPFDIDKSWDEKRQQWTISGKIYKTSNITQSARGDKDVFLEYIVKSICPGFINFKSCARYELCTRWEYAGYEMDAFCEE